MSRNKQRKLQPNFQRLEQRDLLAADLFEPNDTFSEAKDLGTNATVAPTIEPAGDVDVFRWTAPASGYIRFDALFSHSQGDIDVRLFNSSFTQIDFSISPTDNERVGASVTQNQELFVQISETSGLQALPYTLQSTFLQSDALEDNDSIATATNLGSGDKAISGLGIHEPGDDDYFLWTATFDGVLTVDTSFSHFEGDLSLRVLTPAGLELTSSQTLTDNEQATLNVAAGATYVIEVTESQGREQPGYDLGLSFNAPPQITDFPTGVVLGPIGGTTLVNFSIDDANDPVNTLTVTATSSDPFLVPNGNISIFGSGNDRQAVINSPGGFGMTTITITVSDPAGGSASDSFELWLFADNASPVISSIDDVSIPENGISELRDFTVSDGQTVPSNLVVTATSSNTSLVPNTSNNIILGGSSSNRTIRIRPATNTIGTAVITVRVTDEDSDSSSTTFRVTVFDPADQPRITPIDDVTIDEGTSTNPLPFTLTDADTPIAALTVNATSSDLSIVPTSGILISGSGANRTVTVTPSVNASGTVTITLIVSDGSATDTETFNVTVTPVNDLPTITSIANRTIQENTSMPPTPFTVGDVETNPDDLTITIATNNPFLLPVSNIVLGGSGSNRTVSATPIPTRQGAAIVTLTVDDGDGGASQASFVLTVLGDDDPPVISPISDVTIHSGSATDIAFTVSDDSKPSSALFVGAFSSNQSIIEDDDLSILGTDDNRGIRITPKGVGGPVVISVIVSDGVNNTTELFNVNVIEGSPTITSIVNQVINEDTSTVPLSFTIDDPDSPISSLTVSASSSNQSIIPDGNVAIGGSGANRTVTVTPAADVSGGPTTVTLTVSDGTTSSSTTFDVTVTAVDDTPTISAIANQVIDEDGSTGALDFTVDDVDTAVGLLAITVSSSNQALVPDSGVFIGGSGANRTVTVIPTAQASGLATITLTVSDGTSSSSTAFDVNVNAVDDAPTISAVAGQVVEEDGSTGPLDFTVGDLDTPVENLTVSAVSSNQALIPDANIVIGGNGADRTVTVTPAANANGGPATITLTVSDGPNTTSTTFDVSVTAVDDAPTITAIADQVINENGSTGALDFMVDDLELAPGSLTVSAASSDQALVPNANLALTNNGTDRTITVTPAANANGGPVTITVTVTDGTNTTSTTFDVSVTAVDDAPTITAIADQVIDEDGTTGALDFTVGDQESAASSLTVTAVSSDQSLVPDANIVLGGSDADRTVTVTPAANANGGPVTITLTVSDGTNTTSTTFDVSVTAVDDAPTISAIADQVVDEDGSTGALDFTVGDPETAASSLTVTAVSSNQSLVPNANIVLGGSDADRTVTVTPVANASGGPVTITLTVSDGTSTTSTTFDVSVTAVDDAPTISAIADQMVDEDGSTGALDFTVGDLETAASSLTVTAVSSNQSLVPDANVVLGGSDADRTVTVTPVANASGGPVTITLTVSDGTNTTSTTFDVSVTAADDAPTISAIADQVIDEDGSTGPLDFTVGDLDTPVENLTVTAASSDPALIPDANIVIGGSGADRTVTVTPAADANGGPVTITLTVSDGTSSAIETFDVTINAAERVIGDSNGDGFFNSSDLVLIFGAGEYEDDIVGNSTWEEGDWNGDGDFDSSDLIYAFQAGTYGLQPDPPATNVESPASATADEGSPSAESVDIAFTADDLDDLYERTLRRRSLQA